PEPPPPAPRQFQPLRAITATAAFVLSASLMIILLDGREPYIHAQNAIVALEAFDDAQDAAGSFDAIDEQVSIAGPPEIPASVRVPAMDGAVEASEAPVSSRAGAESGATPSSPSRPVKSAAAEQRDAPSTTPV